MSSASGRRDQRSVSIVQERRFNVGIKSSCQQPDLEWSAGVGESYDDLAGCAGRSAEDQGASSMETGSDLGIGWSACLRVCMQNAKRWLNSVSWETEAT